MKITSSIVGQSCPECNINFLFFNVILDIKTEDGLSHSPGQTGLLGYSNFSSTPSSQSLYSYSHTHGQSETLYVLKLRTRYRTQQRTDLLYGISDIALLDGASILAVIPSSSPLSATPVLHQLRSGLLASKVSPPLLFFVGSGPLSPLRPTTQHAKACVSFFGEGVKKNMQMVGRENERIEEKYELQR